MSKAKNQAIVKFQPPRNALAVHPDTDRYRCRFDIRSESSNRIYRISFDTAGSFWTCSCPGNLRHGTCKHLEAAGLFGRKQQAQALRQARELGIV